MLIHSWVWIFVLLHQVRAKLVLPGWRTSDAEQQLPCSSQMCCYRTNAERTNHNLLVMESQCHKTIMWARGFQRMTQLSSEGRRLVCLLKLITWTFESMTAMTVFNSCGEKVHLSTSLTWVLNYFHPHFLLSLHYTKSNYERWISFY